MPETANPATRPCIGPFLWRVFYRDESGAWNPSTGFLMTAAEARAHRAKLERCHPDASYMISDLMSCDAENRSYCRECGMRITDDSGKTIRAHGTRRNGTECPAAADAPSASASGCSRNPTSARTDDECTCWDYENPNPSRHSGFCPLAD